MSSVEETLEQLRLTVTTDREHDPSWSSAIRLRTRLQPAGGPGTKVMPPTYMPPRDGEPPAYIEEQRTIDGEKKHCVSLDSVASQANRCEVALADEIALGNAYVPTIWVDQGEEFGRHSALEFSHRSFDAWVEDALLDGERFGDTPLGKQLAASKRSDLSALLLHSPVAIVLGSWASRIKNPQGAARLARILTSEIVAVGAVKGARAKGKRDLHDISASLKVYEAPEDARDRITLDPDAAKQEKGKAVPFGTEGRNKGNPSAAGYGSVPPEKADTGGITMEYGLQIATVSLPALRECRFPKRPPDEDPTRDVSGRLMLAALSIRLLALQVERGYDLRSGCLLAPEDEPAFELLDRIGQTTATWSALDLDTSALLRRATEEGAKADLDWSDGDIQLSASDVQLELLRRSLVKPTDTE